MKRFSEPKRVLLLDELLRFQHRFGRLVEQWLYLELSGLREGRGAWI